MDGPQDEPEKRAIKEKSSKARRVRVTVLTNLPEKLPVIVGEAALIQAHLNDLLARLAMNDNEEDQ